MEEMKETHTDFAGRKRHFRTVLRETPGGLSAEAIETKDGKGGYRFKVVVPTGAVGAGLWTLRQKMARILNTRHIERDAGGKGSWLPTHDVVRGRIDCDPDSHEPTLVVDGEMLSWDEFARFLLFHEGFDFELRFVE